MTSLQGRLLIVLGVTITLCWASALAVMAYLGQSQSGFWDRKVQALATKILLTNPGREGPNTGDTKLQLRDGQVPESGQFAFQVWSARTALALRSPDAPSSPLRPDFVEGFSSTVIDGQRWRVFSVSDRDGRNYVQVGNLQSVVDAEQQRKAVMALGLLTAVLLLVGAWMWWAVRRSLNPLKAMEAALRQRENFDLRPLPTAQLPSELRPLVASFNHLLEQLDAAVEGERRFIGDAAHELRTPLSALLAQAQVARRASCPAEKDAALVKLVKVAERSTRLSEQLLDLARLNAGGHARHLGLADLRELADHVSREFEIQAEQQHRSILLRTRPCQIACNVDEIGILLRNLVDNALRHSDREGRVRIACGQGADALGRHRWLEVADDGPGVPIEEHEAIFRRFHRVAGSAVPGSGIGLSLVAGIAQLHHARITTGAGLDGRGLSVRVLFPEPPGAWPEDADPTSRDPLERWQGDSSSALPA